MFAYIIFAFSSDKNQLKFPNRSFQFSSAAKSKTGLRCSNVIKLKEKKEKEKLKIRN